MPQEKVDWIQPRRRPRGGRLGSHSQGLRDDVVGSRDLGLVSMSTGRSQPFFLATTKAKAPSAATELAPRPSVKRRTAGEACSSPASTRE